MPREIGKVWCSVCGEIAPRKGPEMAKAKKNWWESQTKVGSLLLAIGTAAQQPGLVEALPANVAPWAAVLQAVGMGLAGFGMRNALGERPAPER